MQRPETCPNCKGNGYVPNFSYDESGNCNGVSSVACPICCRKGYVLVSMTEFDRLKQMSLDELAMYLYHYAHSSNKPLNVGEVVQHLSALAQKD